MSYRKARYGLMSVLALLIPAVAPAADSITRGNDTNLPSQPAACEADLNGDRAVNMLDLIELLMRFGLCPDAHSGLEFTVDDAIDDGRTPAIDNSADAGDAVRDVPQDGISDDLVERDKVPQDSISDDLGERDRRPAVSDAALRAATACRGDLNDDGMVDTLDLIDLLSAPWGPCP